MVATQPKFNVDFKELAVMAIQRQQRGAVILILDDSTSAVDTKTDALIREGFRQYLPDTTKIIIAQRISSVQDADLIIVMDNGKISAQGTHDQLLETSDIYREVYEQQSNGGDSDA